MTQESGLFTKQLKTNYQYLYFIKAVLRGGFFGACEAVLVWISTFMMWGFSNTGRSYNLDLFKKKKKF